MFSEVPADLELKTMNVYVYEGWISKDNLYGFIHGQPECNQADRLVLKHCHNAFLFYANRMNHFLS